jgi:hypothetical protein
MAFTKLYLRTTAAPYTPATIRGAWDDTAGAVTGLLESVPGGDTYTTVSRAETNVATEYDVLLYRGVSGPLDAQTISGTLNVMVDVLESAGAANNHWHLHVYVTQGDSDTPRGTLLTDYREAAGVNEWSINSTGTTLNAAQALSSLAISAGDRLVAEIGYSARNTSASSFSGTLKYGAVYGAVDLIGGVINAVGNGYLVFSNSISEVSQVGRISQLGVESLSTGASVAARVSQLAVETLTAPSVSVRLSQLALETLTATGPWAARVSQLAVETLSENLEEPVVPGTTAAIWMGDGGGTVWIE